MATGDFKVECCDFKYTYEPSVAWTCTSAKVACEPEPTLAEQVKELEDEKDEVEKELAEAKAKLAAEEKARTYGEKFANGFVKRHAFEDRRDGGRALRLGSTFVVQFHGGADIGNVIDYVQGEVAAALDKAYADGAAEQREKCVTAYMKVARACCYSGHASERDVQAIRSAK